MYIEEAIEIIKAGNECYEENLHHLHGLNLPAIKKSRL